MAELTAASRKRAAGAAWILPPGSCKQTRILCGARGGRQRLSSRGLYFLEISDGNGWTVAHAASFFGNIPKGFSRRELSCKKGRTAMEAAEEFRRRDLE